MSLDDLLDVVNEQDHVIDRASRGEIHKQDLRHRAVHVWFFNGKGEILLQMRSDKKDRHPNVWDSSASGHVDLGEAYDVSAHREVEEELGIPSPRLKEIAYFKAQEETGWEFIRLYTGRHEGPFDPCEEEVSEVRWFTLPEWDAQMRSKSGDFAPALAFMWKEIQSRGGDFLRRIVEGDMGDSGTG